MATQSEYLLVEWVTENKFSVENRKKICEDVWRNKSDDELVGQKIDIFWGKKKQFNASVIQCGTLTNMKHELEVLLEQQREEIRTSKKPTSELAQDIRGVLHEVDQAVEPTNKILQDKVDHLELKLENQINLTAKYKEKAKSLKRKLDNRDLQNSDEMANIGEDIFLPKSQLQTILAMSDDPGKLARNLVRALYSDDELIGHSLFGKKCNANINQIARPSIDAGRRDAIILFTLEKFHGVHQPGESVKKKNLMLRSLHQIMGDQLRHLTRKCKT